ncbi:hypothetical protein [Micromonospora sp. NBC_01412]|uniref:hypothetical protein n=1 Tax=Micromonospora sp. NBC_01412 TaxID=2903590 RepID=UPI0032526CBB
MRKTLTAAALAILAGTSTLTAAPTPAQADPPPPRSGPAYRPTRPTVAPPAMPAAISGSTWSSGHVQGLAVDWVGGHAYWSFTNLLVKTNIQTGQVIGTVTGLTGHLGDLDINPDNGLIYGSLEYKTRQAFYIAVFDGTRITRTGMNAEADGVMTTVYLPEVAADYTTGRYGTSGIDGISFGPRLGTTGTAQRNMLVVAYGITPDTTRTDNDHQVLLTYDVRGWNTYARPLTQTAPHLSGPPHPADKVFIHTGNTTWGVQSLEYDRHNRLWLMAAYQGTKPQFPNWTLFAVSAGVAPQTLPLAGQPAGTTGRTVPLAPAGTTDPATGIRGWTAPGSVGLETLGDGRIYVVSSGTTTVNGTIQQTGTASLYQWTGGTPVPYTTVTPLRGQRR